MHELGLVVEVVDRVEKYLNETDSGKLQKVVLRVGEGFSVVPGMMLNVYEKAVAGTSLEGSQLELELVEASAKCLKCGRHMNPLASNGICPNCGSEEYNVLSGREFEIKELVVKNE